MRYAIVSDIHANWQAWSAVRDDIRKRGADTMVCLGDIVGYGPSPTRVFADLLARCDNIVLGNHDAAAAGGLDPSSFNANARRSTAWTAAQFDRASLKRLGEAPLVLEDEDICFVHAETPAPAEFGYVETEDDARACFEATDKRFIFIGHTHKPLVFALAPDGTVSTTTEPRVRVANGMRYLVNVGSVGDPGDGTDQASYCIFDTLTGEISLRKVGFDVAGFRAELERIPELSLPWFLQRHEGETARPVYDQAVAAGKVAGTKIRVPASHARIRISSSALSTHAGESLRLASEAAKGPAKKRRGSRTGIVVALLSVAAAGALTGIYFNTTRSEQVTAADANAVAAAPAAAASTGISAAPQPLLASLHAVASREELVDGKTNLALMAVDGDPGTRWCSGDKLAEHWLQIELGKELPLGGMNIAWEFPDLAYGYRIEGSLNARRWSVLTEGSGRSQDRIALTANCSYVRITVTNMPAGKWASIAEVTFFDTDGRGIKSAPPDISAVQAPAPPVKPATPATDNALSAEDYMSIDSLGRIPEAKDYRLVYDLDLAKLGPKIPYAVDNTAGAPRFDRVAYLVELKKASESARFLWASMDAFTAEAGKLGVPTAESGARFQQTVSNLTVVSDAPGIATGERIGAGNIEFWSSNYGPQNLAKLPGASDKVYDFGDGPSGPNGGYGSMQIHHTAAKQTLFAINNWRAGNKACIGIGTNSGKNPDWTFEENSRLYSAKRLRVFIRPAQ